jgi:hypothetical protein
MKDVLLMFTKEVTEDGILLASVGDGTTGTVLPLPAPIDIAKHLIGRHVWIKGNWGDKPEVLQWLPLPTYEAKP